MTSFAFGKPTSIFNHALRGALVWVCLSVAVGNGLSAWLLNMQSCMVCQSLFTEEVPAEEAPNETELPVEQVNSDEFAAQSPRDSSARRISSKLRRLTKRQTRGSYAERTLPIAGASPMQLRNGCGAALRC